MTENLFWHAVALSRKIKSKPVRVVFEDEPLVLFRNNEGLNCLRDICPHRGASLSKGRVVDGAIECPYHGWRFNGEGRCTHLPLYDGETPKRFVRAYDVCEKYGLIFITRDKDKAQPIAEQVWDNQPSVSIVMENTVKSSLVDIIENVLDPAHSAFVHKGLVRGSKGEINKLHLTASTENGVLIVKHQGEKRQNGLVSRLLEGERSHAINRFFMPGNLSLEYYSIKGLSLVFTIYFTRSHNNNYMAFAHMRGPKQKGFGYFKALLFVPVIGKIFNQDKIILGDVTDNLQFVEKRQFALSPFDIYRSMVDEIITTNGEPINIPSVEITMET